jgi:hypothetical protein
MADKGIFSQKTSADELVIANVTQQALRTTCGVLEAKIVEIDAQLANLQNILARLEEAQQKKSIQSLAMCQTSSNDPFTSIPSNSAAGLLLGDTVPLQQSIQAAKGQQNTAETMTIRRSSRELCETTRSTRSTRVEIKKLQIARQKLRLELGSKQKELNDTLLRDRSLNILQQQSPDIISTTPSVRGA